MTDEINKEEESKSPKKAGRKWPFWIVSLVCLILAFFVPYNLTYDSASHPWSPGVKTRDEPAPRTVESATKEAVRSGIMGVSVALLIIIIWKVDQLLFRKKDIDMDGSFKFKFVLSLLAFVLWVVWTSSGHIMIRANDEVHDNPVNVNAL